MKLCLIFPVAFVLAGCPRSDPAPAPLRDADASLADEDPSACAPACSALSLVHCPEGDNLPACTAACTQVQTDHLSPLHPGCVARAHSVDDVRACGPAFACAR